MLAMHSSDTPRSSLYIGVMSGTSLDGVDAVLVDFTDTLDVDGQKTDQKTHVYAHHYLPFTPALRQDLLSLQSSASDEINRMMSAANALTRLYAEAVRVLCQTEPKAKIAAIGAHGQTIRHRPNLGFTLQIIQPALLAELTNIDVVCDFRSRDIAAGGQGAPLVPAFHQAQFADVMSHSASNARLNLAARAVINIGGFANMTWLPPSGPVLGFDTGPGNVLMDAWCQQHLGKEYDADGQWAARGRVNAALLQDLLATPFFHQAPPKSTGRDDFHMDWLMARIAAVEDATKQVVASQDVQATLCALTVESIAASLRQCTQEQVCSDVILCGGGVLNSYLVQCLRQRMIVDFPKIRIASSAQWGIPPTQVEAVAFAWLARAFLVGESANLPSVTGARGLRRLGALYPA